MRKLNWYTIIGIGLITIAILLTRLNLQQNEVLFTQGLSIGLGLVLIIKGFLVRRKTTFKN
jgi:hypothetical protein